MPQRASMMELDVRVEESPLQSPSPPSLRLKTPSQSVKKPKSPPLRSPTVKILDEKSRLMLQVIQDYGPYSPRREYSCRSLPKPRDQDFILRHNAQNIHDFKSEYSKRFGTLNRRPAMFQAALSPSSSSLRSPSAGRARESLWRESKDAVWILTDHGKQTLLANNSNLSPLPRLTTTLPAIHTNPTRPFQHQAAVGSRVDLSQQTSLASLVRLELYSPRNKPKVEQRPDAACRPSTSDGFSHAASSSPLSSWTPRYRPHSSDDKESSSHLALSPPLPPHSPSPLSITTPSVISIEPSIVNFHVVQIGRTYAFPVQVHNVGAKTDRFRVRSLKVKSGGVDCSRADAHYDKNKAKLAPGLRATVTLFVVFAAAGSIQGILEVETPAGKGGVAIIGAVEAPSSKRTL
ncbi:hypothetical protein LEN26_019362 [Aphanomyces euteiches]|nr:hypothetical protein LEN26_019362 [Aphanomyces euteiches]KAH9113275.1 hypothetical protein AeMF1_012479 [Aphanomyces euteiches]KAH9184751.1 hypothetical protein AeNC1_013272 [Aphanomyces euteiches]